MLDQWTIFEVIVFIVSFVGGFATGFWKLSQYITRNTIVTESNNEKLTTIELQLDNLVKEKYAERERFLSQFNEHDRRITKAETNISIINQKVDDIKNDIRVYTKKQIKSNLNNGEDDEQ